MAEIMTKNTPWEGKTGEQVESFVKGSLSKLIGVIYKDPEYDEYLCFNDEQDRDTYLANPSREDLVLARFDAAYKANVAAITIISKPADRVEIGSTGNVITFSFTIKDASGTSTGETADITYNFRNTSSGSVLTGTTTAKVGSTLSLNIDNYLQAGENIIKITVRGKSTNAVASVDVTCVAYSQAPTEVVMISGLNALIEGNSTQYIAIADSVPTSATWSIVGAASGASIDPSSGILYTTKTGVTRSITIQAMIASGATATKTVTIQKEESVTTGVTTIRIDQNVNDPDSMITLLTDRSALEAIRSNSHRYLGKLTGTGKMTICQLWDGNSNYYHDKTTAADLTGGQGNVFMRLPKFWYKAVESGTDVWDISFSYDEQSTDAGWNVWDDSWLIGVYKLSGGGISGYKSVSGATFVYNNCFDLQYDVFMQSGNAGYSLVDFPHHSMMAFLFFAYYNSTNPRAICGSGGSFDATTTGVTNNLGMSDTEENGKEDQRVNFWGLEDWWGGFYEWLGNGSVTYDRDGGVLSWNISGNVESTNAPSGATFISQLNIGSSVSALPKELSLSGSETTSYCDEVVAENASNYPIARGGAGSGITALQARYAKSTNPDQNVYGSRLAFQGTITVESNIQNFIKL